MDDTDVEMAQDEPKSTDISSAWLDHFLKGNFEAAEFKHHWSRWVPKIYSPALSENCLNWTFNETLAQEVLFLPLEEFICNGNPDEVFKHISELNKQPSVCGKFFKNADPTYSCRECGMDKTCVLCVECFKHSEHRFHKYRMGMSGGGGCCDCGDVEAWKRAPFCELHRGDQSEGDGKGILAPDLLERTRLVFDTVLWYAFRRLTTDLVASLKSDGISEDIFDLDEYCTILYNDEVHTFEQVINTLGRVLKCTQRSSTEFVTSIDREGRAIVKCSTFQHCSDLKQEIEKYTSKHGSKPLKVLVNHTHVIAHQIFAMKLLNWLEKLLGNGAAFRAVFSECASKPPQPMRPCLITEIMLYDSTLWKSARTQWHRLLIAGMLLEYENKKTLAKLFTKNYAQIMKDFIRDDHEHSYSISSLAVQLYTVPTLAQHLIENDDVLFILLNTLMSEYDKKCNKAGKLEFERNPSFHTFKRTLFMLYDLKYLLTYPPERWTDNLRRSFLHGFSVLLTLLVKMQGMDAVTRQVGQHMEYEPEWESGFNLHIKLAYCISQVIEWCGTDRVILIKAYRLVLKALEENPCYEPNEAGEVRELADHGTACLHYDVSSKPVSIHLPLTRLLAALHLRLEKFGLHFDGQEFQVVKPTPVQIIEPVLRAQVMIAQVHAGMWRRNGYALLNTLYFYHNVKCRTEMLDRDIALLQIGASLIESNEFLIHVLNKFNLINWALPDFETNSLKASEDDNMRQTINLVEELLHLLVVIVGERYMPGVSDVTVKDRIKKDVLQSLCIKPAPHSELVKCVSDDLEIEDGIVDKVIHEIAVFKSPTQSTGKGVYELKEEYFNDFNVFFYHYTREELSKAEEAQRKRRKAAGELECCPPPKLPKLTESFALLVNLLQCDVMLHVMRTVFERCLNLRARSFSEPQLHKVLHLIGYALLEEQSGNYPFFRFVENASKFGIFTLMEEIVKSPRIDAHKGILRWILIKYQEVASKGGQTANAQGECGAATENADNEKERRAKLAAEKRAKIMAQMQAMQKNFIKENAKLFEETAGMDTGAENTEHPVAMEVAESRPIALGPNQSQRVSVEKTFTCILCQETEKITADGPAMVLAAFVQQSTVLCQHKNNKTLLDLGQHDPLFLHANLGPAPHTSTCGHVMHSDCWRKYFDSVMVREHRRPYRLRHPSSFDVDKQEFLCPLCECLSNTVLPLVPSLYKLQPSLPRNDTSFEDWLADINLVLEKKTRVCHGIFQCNLTERCENLHCVACVNASSGTSIDQDSSDECDVNCILQPHQVFYACPVDGTSGDLSPGFVAMFPTTPTIAVGSNLKEMIQVFAQVTYTRGLNVNPHPSDKRLAPLAWKSLAYTIYSIELTLQSSGKPVLGALTSRQRDSIENLVKVVAALGGTWSRSVVINSHALYLLSVLFENSNENPSLLLFDSFGFLVSLTFALPSLLAKDAPCPVPTGGTLEWHVLRTIFVSHIVKILILLKPDEMIADESETDEDADAANDILEVLTIIGKHRDGLNGSDVWQHVKASCYPFLRCCVLFYHYLTDVPGSGQLARPGGATFDEICSYLDLPTSPGDLFRSRYVRALIERWCGHEEVAAYLAGSPLLVIEEPVKLPRLVDLPDDYSELINAASTFKCPNNEEDCRNPTMCLACGKILCSQSYCCQAEFNKIAVGACNLHASKCGAGVGIFLRIRDCELLLLTAPHRGCFIVPPYLDDHGETDQGLRRGNPLKLSRERYEKLQNLWLAHGIHEEIARQIETSNHIVATQWNML
ncbi:E3 ubiquitin-protein ligase UBR2 [Cylas formicarius]|uniref:E3 ubiquitin-protein ligase UBR2 n=1 Tax=Cylas formicarius TaxID=197179 RepID=UPI0029589D3B|nr:E3 ubiquitin-protein ligase UBR2 [Cylas formicarius]